ncbi:MAG: hypothetical protein F6J87_20895 [Spirulina sp. SIO3F2]|nr:hypothetical protein [Spirulina sp. SIO3F2]
MVIPLATVATLGVMGANSAWAITLPTTTQIAPVQQPLTPIYEKEWEPDNEGSPDDTSGAGGRWRSAVETQSKSLY